MRIVYGFRNSDASSIRCNRIAHALLRAGHEIKILSTGLTWPFISALDWQVSSLATETKKNNISGKFSSPLFKDLEKEILNYSPDLIISDLEMYSARVAEKLTIPLWYCSPELIWSSVHLQKLGFNLAFKNSIIEEQDDKFKQFFPLAEKILIYSPIGNLVDWQLNPNYFWVKPFSVWDLVNQSYNKIDSQLGVLWSSLNRNFNLIKLFNSLQFPTNILSSMDFKYPLINGYRYTIDNVIKILNKSNIICCSGESHWVIDTMEANLPLLLIPEVSTLESLQSSLIYEFLGLENLWQVELLERYSKKELIETLPKSKMLEQKFVRPNLIDYLRQI